MSVGGWSILLYLVLHPPSAVFLEIEVAYVNKKAHFHPSQPKKLSPDTFKAVCF